MAMTLAAVMFCVSGQATAASASESLERYTTTLEKLHAELTAKIAKLSLEKAKTADSPEARELVKFLASDALDTKLVKYVVLQDATPEGLAGFAKQGKKHAALIEQLLADHGLMKQMLVADGPRSTGRGAPAQYGPAMLIYADIQKASERAKGGALQRLALAVSLEFAGSVAKKSAEEGAPATEDAVNRYLHYEKAYLGGELDPAFGQFTVWELRLVVNGGDSDEGLAWGREMLRNLRPDHIYDAPSAVRYSVVVNTCVKYGSGHVVFDRPELHPAQNIIMNGGVCGRRAAMGRFVLRSFGIPNTARPSPGHGALCRWTPDGWWVNLGPNWGRGTVWGSKDLWFLETTQAREDKEAFLQVKRAYWIGDVLGEKRTSMSYHANPPEGWNGVALRHQRAVIERGKAAAPEVPTDEIDPLIGPTMAQKVMATPITPADRKINHGDDGTILIPAAACTPRDASPCVMAMKSFGGGLQIFLPRISTSGNGKTIVRGGGYGQEGKFCKSGWRMKDGNKNPAHYSYANWGFRAAMTAPADHNPSELKVDLGDGVELELVYIKPGTFVMGGENTWDNRFGCYELPKHEITITKGFYLGKYEVTQGQYDAIMGSKPGGSPRDPNLPAGNITVGNARKFCEKVSDATGRDVRLPTEAEWEYACRAGSTTKWFFGDDPLKLGDYAWYKENDEGKPHPVGQKKPNPWGLYDICGNVFERVSDVYVKDYYANSPKENPTGPTQFGEGGTAFKYTITVPEAGQYALSAKVVTVNFNQGLHVSINGGESEAAVDAPFTYGKWQDTEPVTLSLKEGRNTLKFTRRNPGSPQLHEGKETLHFQRSMAIKSFTLKPL